MGGGRWFERAKQAGLGHSSWEGFLLMGRISSWPPSMGWVSMGLLRDSKCVREHTGTLVVLGRCGTVLVLPA